MVSPILLFLYTPGDFWYDEMTKEGKQFHGMNTVNITKLDTLVSIFKKQIEDCGFVYWDQTVPATSNVANTICGIDGYLPVKYETKANSFYNNILQLCQDNSITVKSMSLVGMFTGTGMVPDTKIKSSGSAKCDAYLWAMDKYMDRCSTRYMAYCVDAASSIEGSPLANQEYSLSASMLYIYDYDYFIARRCFFVDLNAYDGEIPCDDPTQPMGTDPNTLRRILLRRYDRANGNFGQITGFPPFLLKYSMTNGNSKYADNVVCEFITVQTFTAYNLAIEADCPSPPSTANTSVTYKYICRTESLENSKSNEEFVYDPDTKYITMGLGDYDSPAWQVYFVSLYWNDPARGTLPLAWGFNPNNSDRIPNVFEYIYDNKTDNDYFIETNGCGYIWPVLLTQGQSFKTYNNNVTFERFLPSGIDKYKTYAMKYLKLFDMTYVGFLIDVDLPISDSKLLDAYNEMHTLGCGFYGPDSQAFFAYNGKSYMKNNGITGDNLAAFNTIKKSRSQFVRLGSCVQSPTTVKNWINEILEIAETKDVKIEYLDMFTFYEACNKYGNFPDWKG